MSCGGDESDRKKHWGSVCVYVFFIYINICKY